MRRFAPLSYLIALTSLSCGGPEEAVSVELPVVVDPSGVTTVTTDLGYEVQLTEARAMVENFAFTIAGEAHTASLWQKVSDYLVPNAFAHPGHYQGGDVTGELRGKYLLNWVPGGEVALGMATLLVGDYKSVNFTFSQAGAEVVAADDPLLGHTAILRGQASRGDDSIEFVAILDSPEDRELVGVPFEFEVKETSTEQLNVRLDPKDPLEGDTLFDGLDFVDLDTDGDGQVVIEATATEAVVVDAYNLLRRTFQTHDHFEVTATLPDGP